MDVLQLFTLLFLHWKVSHVPRGTSLLLSCEPFVVILSNITLKTNFKEIARTLFSIIKFFKVRSTKEYQNKAKWKCLFLNQADLSRFLIYISLSSLYLVFLAMTPYSEQRIHNRFYLCANISELL